MPDPAICVFPRPRVPETDMPAATVAQEPPQLLPPLKGQPVIPRLDLPAIKASMPMVVAKLECKGQQVQAFSSSDDDPDDDDSDFQ